MKTPEGRIKKQIVDWLRQRRAYVFAPVQQGYGASTLDLLVCWDGTFVAIEVKAPGGKATKRQDMILTQIQTAGGLALLVRSLDEVRYFLETRA